MKDPSFPVDKVEQDVVKYALRRVADELELEGNEPREIAIRVTRQGEVLYRVEVRGLTEPITGMLTAVK